jgi:D-amino-acid dehydrogenase
MSGPALETSFANAGEISPGYASPWASPDVPAKAPKWLFMEHAPLIIQYHKLSPAMVSWCLAMLRNCTPARYAANKARMVRLATYSRDMLRDLRAAEGIDYDHRSLGTLQLFRTQKQYDGAARDIEVLKSGGIDFELLMPQTPSSAACACRAMKPATVSSSRMRSPPSRRRAV